MRDKPWVGPVAWSLFAVGFVMILAAGKAVAVAQVGIVVALVGLVLLVVSGRVWPKR